MVLQDRTGFKNIIGTGSNGQDEAAIYPTLFIFQFDRVQSVLNSSSLEETTVFPRIVSSLEQLLPFNSCRSIYYVKVEFLRQLYGISYIFQLQKRIVVSTIIRGNTVCRFNLFNLKSRNLSLLLYSTYISDAVTRWAGWALVHSEFVSSVNSIPTRGQIMPTTLLLAHPDLKTQRHLCICIQIIK